MFFKKKKFSVGPEQTGFMYQGNKFIKTLEPGVYEFRDPKNTIVIYSISRFPQYRTFSNQELLSKDNIALRFSYHVFYQIADPAKIMKHFDFSGGEMGIQNAVGEYIHSVTQVGVRERISVLLSEEINEKRNSLTENLVTELNGKTLERGIELTEITIRDITFPKMIQDLFAKILESKIRSKSDLENARTQVAAARALKNASEIIKGDENFKFLHYIEALTKIAEKGKHTFVFGDLKSINESLK